VSHLLERMAFKATLNRTSFRVTREVRPSRSRCFRAAFSQQP
jgi:predicted Zn-dependent peptidase